MPSRCEGCGAPGVPGESCSWCGAPPGESSERRCVGCSTFTDAPDGICPECFQTLRKSRSSPPYTPPPPAVEPAPPPAKTRCHGCGKQIEGPAALCAACARLRAAPRHGLFAKLEDGLVARPRLGQLLFLSVVVVAPIGMVIFGVTWGAPIDHDAEPLYFPLYPRMVPPLPARPDPEVDLARALKPGDVATLTNHRVAGHQSDSILVFPTRAALELAGKAEAARDGAGLEKARKAGFFVGWNTRARILQPVPARLYAEVRILDGPWKDRTGWLPTLQIQR